MTSIFERKKINPRPSERSEHKLARINLARPLTAYFELDTMPEIDFNLDQIPDDFSPPSQVINYENLKLLSYSAIQTLRACPRKFELDRLLTEQKDSGTIHTAFGSALGSGIQKIIETGSLEKGIWAAFQDWHVLLSEENTKSYKSFPLVVLGLHNFLATAYPQFGDWELAYLKDGKPAVELSFAVILPRGYYYRGFLDGVLKNKRTGKYRVLELKTTGSRYTSEVTYANSFQGVGYSVVLDRIAPEGYSDYEVLYLVYKTFNQTFEDYPFIKTPQHRVNWINDLLLTIEQLESYQRVKRFPQNGDACMAYGRPCRFFDTCNLSNQSLFSGMEEKRESTFKAEEFDFIFTLDELLNAQFHKIGRK